MAILITILLIIALMLIAASQLTGINKSAIAMFAGTVGWVLYISFGSDFVMDQHPMDYLHYLAGATANSTAVKEYISSNVFIVYVGRAAEIVLFLLATMTIVEILDSNGCFDFLSVWLRTRNKHRLIWSVSALAFFLSANLDNLTTTMLMLVVMHKMLPNRKQRAVIGSAIVISANIGGALTVIGDPNGLLLWSQGAVTPSHFSAWMALPCLAAWTVPVFWLSTMLPERVDLERVRLPYRGDDTRLKVWQRLVMFFFGIGGLWFIPTFHNITKLSPFLGALCVLALLWMVHEIFNRKLLQTERSDNSALPRLLQYNLIQTMLFVMGIMLMTGVFVETGAAEWIGNECLASMGDTWTLVIAPCLAAICSLVLDTFSTASAFFSLYNISGDAAELACNGEYWIAIAYATAVGGSIFAIGSTSGLAMLSMKSASFGWYLKHVTPKIIVGGLLGLLILIAEAYWF